LQEDIALSTSLLCRSGTESSVEKHSQEHHLYFFNDKFLIGENRTCIYTRASELQAFRIIRSQ